MVFFSRLAFVLLFLLSSLPVLAGDQGQVVSLSQANNNQYLGAYLSYIEDRTGALSIAQVQSSSSDIPWSSNDSAVPNFGYTDSVYWFRLNIKNDNTKSLERFLEISYPLLDHIEYHVFVDGMLVQNIHTGDQHPFDSRPIPNRDFLFPVILEPEQNATLFFRVTTSGSMQLPLSLWEKQAFFVGDQSDIIRKSLFYGVLLVMVLYNLFLYLSLREPAYLYYVLFVAAFLETQAAMNGFLFQYVWPDSPRLQELGILVGVPANVLFTSLFASNFLNLKDCAPRVNRFFRITAFLGGLSMLGAFFLPYAISTRISVFLVVPVSVACLILGPYLWHKGYKIARFFTIAWAFMVVGTTMLALNKFGVLPSNFLTENGLQFGSALEAILLSFALADRLNRERDERFKAQNKLLVEVNQKQKIKQQMIFEATHHSLSGLPNRMLLQQQFDQWVGVKPDAKMSLMMVHFGRFHEINKTLGHLKADELYKDVVSILNEKISHLVGILPLDSVLSQTSSLAIVEGVSVAVLIDRKDTVRHKINIDKVASLVNQPEEFQGLSIELGAKIGITHFPEQGNDISTLLRNSLIAIDVGIQKSQYLTLYSDDINPYSEKLLSLAGDLRKALKHGGLELYFHPQVSLKTNNPVAVEALLRWNHPEYGFIPPDEFIPLAEQTGVINEVTKWVLREAIARAVQLHESEKYINMAVNISAINLKQSDFVDYVKSLLDEYKFKPQSLVLEVTETAIMDDPVNALEVLTTLSDMGICISIDDFGTGYSSLSYIKQLPVKEVKIDRSFVTDLDVDHENAVIVSTAINMSHDLNFKVVAEGVETESVNTCLRNLGCDYAQGFLLTKPIPYAELFIWFETYSNSKLPSLSRISSD